MAIRAPIRRQAIHPQENKLEEKPSNPAVKERPMLFSAPMVRALLDGSKTQTRRVAKFKPRTSGCNLSFSAMRVAHYMTGNPRAGFVLSSGAGDSTFPLICPYGQPGDRLWVRETLGHHSDKGHYYAATGMHIGPLLDYEREPSPSVGIPARNIPSIHMPRWASRILLEIVSVRVERLNECSEADALAEGIPWRQCTDWMGPSGTRRDFGPQDAYRELWDGINGAGSWAANPWVWVVEFKRTTP